MNVRRYFVAAAVVAALAGTPSAFASATVGGSAWGFVWADQPTAASYTPDPAYQRNSANALNTIRRWSTGQYDVTFTNLGGFSFENAGTVNVTAYGSGSEVCNVARWYYGGYDGHVSVRVHCYGADGSPVDTQFTASFTRRVGASSGRFAYVWADGTVQGTHTPDAFLQYNSTGALNTVTRTATGVYQVRLSGLAGSGGTVMVTAYHPGYGYPTRGTDTCSVSSWNASGSDELVNVVCHKPGGSPTDTAFTMSFAGSGDLLGAARPAFGWVWANKPKASAYVPSRAYQANSSGNVNRVARWGQGSYEVVLPGIQDGGHVQVSSYGSVSNRCKVDSWGSWVDNDGLAMHVYLFCFNAAGALVDSRFVLNFVD